MADPEKIEVSTVDLTCHVLPLLRLGQWAAQAGEVLQEVQFWREKSPAFETAWKKHLAGVKNPETWMPSELIAETLGVAIELLERYEAEEE